MKNIEILEKKHYPLALDIYSNQKVFFSLIGAVLEEKQNGIVLTDSNIKPTVFFVIHKFGFSFYYELLSRDDLDETIFGFITAKRCDFLPDKIRWYAPPERWISRLESLNSKYVQRAERSQFRLFGNIFPGHSKKSFVSVEKIDDNLLGMLEAEFELSLTSRFWASADDFCKNSFGCVVKYNDDFTSICYAAAISNNIAEIDVATKPEYKRKGFGKVATISFLQECSKRKIIPNWDCYLNNLPSFKLATSLGFNIIYRYPLFTISRNQ